ncbi:MAG: hypothetical protein GEU94_17600 [Micromonosporaceae bacterium]|nr:hypothetical protein [Micromonosporaceae bacterium]
MSPQASVTGGHRHADPAYAASAPPPHHHRGQPSQFGQTYPAGNQPAAPQRHSVAKDESTRFGGALGADEPPMRMRLLIALCAWAASLTILGLGVGLWAMLRLMSHGTPGWYEPVIVATGLIGICLAIASFVTADRRHVPWVLMGASTAVLFVAIGITANAG